VRLAIAFVVAGLFMVPGFAAADPQISPYVVIERCRGGCMLHGGADDARANASSLPCAGEPVCTGGGCLCQAGSSGDYMIDEFQSADGETGAAADAEWNAIMQCIRELYSPYGVIVTETPPPGGQAFNVGIAAGRPENIGYSSNQIAGIAPGTPGCDPRQNVISFSFANVYRGPRRVQDICETIAQETAHAYGLDHAFEFSDGRSACSDPMTYRTDCGGQKFFRNDLAKCGEFGARPCACGGFQNSHQRLLSIFGPGTPITTPPTLTVTSPTNGGTISNGAAVLATAGAQRGIARLELWLNDYRWLTVKGVPFGPTGQPESTYPLVLPQSVPDGIIDIVVKAFDDINVETDSPVITVTKGQPCASADTCAKGQLCEEGKCFWAPPTGQIGETCDYPQFCESELCLDTIDGMYCSQSCVVGVVDSCPTGFTCEGAAGETGSCVRETAESGCCSASDDGRTAALLSFGVLGVLVARPRRRRRR
jgi:hypothetical protein